MKRARRLEYILSVLVAVLLFPLAIPLLAILFAALLASRWEAPPATPSSSPTDAEQAITSNVAIETDLGEALIEQLHIPPPSEGGVDIQPCPRHDGGWFTVHLTTGDVRDPCEVCLREQMDRRLGRPRL